MSARPRVIALWKPYGVVSRFTPAGGHPGLATLIRVPMAGVWPIGRLDHDSEGLLLLGDDGGLAARLTSPRFAHPRTYLAEVERVPDARARDALAAGVVLQGRRMRPARVRLLPEPPALPPRWKALRVPKRGCRKLFDNPRLAAIIGAGAKSGSHTRSRGACGEGGRARPGDRHHDPP